MNRMFDFRFPGLVCAALAMLAAGPAAAQHRAPDVVAQGYPADSCMSRREAKATILSGRAVRLREVRGAAEKAAGGEMINAEMCWRGGEVVYVLTVLSSSGKVVYVTLNAATGQLIGTR